MSYREDCAQCKTLREELETTQAALEAARKKPKTKYVWTNRAEGYDSDAAFFWSVVWVLCTVAFGTVVILYGTGAYTKSALFVYLIVTAKYLHAHLDRVPA